MSLEKIRAYLKEYSYLKGIEALLQWDMETMMPEGAVEDRAQRLSYVQGKIHSLLTAKKYAALLREFEGEKLKPREKKLLSELRFDHDLSRALPLRFVQELSLCQTRATHAWARARRENDWKAFLPHLEKLVDLKRTETGFFQVKKPYDALLRKHDKEFTSAQITALFSELKGALVPLKEKVIADGKFVTVPDLKGPFAVPAQKELSLLAARVCGLPEKNSRLDVSTHPFSINISPADQRITTRYVEENLDSLSSTMHEVGHALYEAGLPAEWEGTPFAEAISLSVHESQSRFWENVVGRSREFCQFLHPHMARLFPKAMKGVDEERLFYVFNKSVPGHIRVESSELYYNLHVIIRYEIEELVFNYGLGAAEIPALWNEKYLAYLDLTPRTFAEGVLQDSHWAGGAFGYFPTYTLGNLITGSLYQKMKTELPGFQRDLATGKTDHVLEFLRKTIHVKGRSVGSKDVIGRLEVKDYVSYLKEKFKVK